MLSALVLLGRSKTATGFGFGGEKGSIVVGDVLAENPSSDFPLIKASGSGMSVLLVSASGEDTRTGGGGGNSGFMVGSTGGGFLTGSVSGFAPCLVCTIKSCTFLWISSVCSFFSLTIMEVVKLGSTLRLLCYVRINVTIITMVM